MMPGTSLPPLTGVQCRAYLGPIIFHVISNQDSRSYSEKGAQNDIAKCAFSIMETFILDQLLHPDNFATIATISGSSDVQLRKLATTAGCNFYRSLDYLVAVLTQFTQPRGAR